MRAWKIPVGMTQRDSLLLAPPAAVGDGHRGLWFYDPSVVGGTIEVGDAVRFVIFGDAVLACGRVLSLERPDDHPKFCSRINHAGFRWEAVDPAFVDEYERAAVAIAAAERAEGVPLLPTPFEVGEWVL